jgi:succinate dehydrogenase/fumarate reductase flavoprotein subunit
MGGIQINKNAQVIGLSKQPIKHLYAAGEVTGGIHGACRLGSCAIIDCLVFGRLAGKNVALNHS